LIAVVLFFLADIFPPIYNMTMKKMLSEKFFVRPALTVARGLLGKFLVRKIKIPLSRGVAAPRGRGVLSGYKDEAAVMITEVEAYDGPRDRASHASRGKTPRNAVMFGKGGYFYVYLCYGMYEMLNIVTGPEDYPAAILLRGAIIKSPLLRGVAEGRGVLNLNLDGPGKLTRFLKVGRNFNKKSAGIKTGLWFEDRGVKITDKMIKRTPRVGVAYAGSVWSKKKYRFLLTNSPK
jgi:DNA-3-methyladenine glycosylase